MKKKLQGSTGMKSCHDRYCAHATIYESSANKVNQKFQFLSVNIFLSCRKKTVETDKNQQEKATCTKLCASVQASQDITKFVAIIPRRETTGYPAKYKQ